MNVKADKIDDRRERTEEVLELPPFFAALGYSVEELGEDRVVFRMDAPKSFYTPYGAVHGGIVAALMDTVGGAVVAMKLTPADRIATHSLQVSFTSFVREPSCRCIGRLVAMGRSVATVEIEVRKEDGTVAAKGLGTFGIFRNKNRDI